MCPVARSTSCPAAATSALTCAPPPTPSRNALVADIWPAQAERIATRRRVSLVLEETMVAPPRLRPRPVSPLEAAVGLGPAVQHLPSGAGHDAMKLHEVMPQAMLFVRGGNGGISHNRWRR